MAELPALTRFYGLTPMDLDQMSLREVSEYVNQMHQATEEGGD